MAGKVVIIPEKNKFADDPITRIESGHRQCKTFANLKRLFPGAEFWLTLRFTHRRTERTGAVKASAIKASGKYQP